jgi:hypothetical protein
MHGEKGVGGGIAERLGDAQYGPDGKQLPRGSGQSQEEGDPAAQGNGNREATLQAGAVCYPAQGRLGGKGDRDVERGENADLGEAQAKVDGVERQRVADDSEAQAREEALGNESHERPVGACPLRSHRSIVSPAPTGANSPCSPPA